MPREFSHTTNYQSFIDTKFLPLLHNQNNSSIQKLLFFVLFMTSFNSKTEIHHFCFKKLPNLLYEHELEVTI